MVPSAPNFAHFVIAFGIGESTLEGAVCIVYLSPHPPDGGARTMANAIADYPIVGQDSCRRLSVTSLAKNGSTSANPTTRQ